MSSIDPNKYTHPDYLPGAPGWRRIQDATPPPDRTDAIHVMAKPVDNPQTIDELMEMTNMTIVDMAKAPDIQGMQAAPPAPQLTPPAADPVIDGKRRLAQTIRAAYNTPGLKTEMDAVLVGYEELTTAELMGKLAVDALKSSIEERKDELAIGVAGKNDAERKANHAQAIRDDETVKMLKADLKNAEHEYTANLAKRKAVKARMRMIEMKAIVTAAEVRVLEGA